MKTVANLKKEISLITVELNHLIFKSNNLHEIYKKEKNSNKINKLVKIANKINAKIIYLFKKQGLLKKDLFNEVCTILFSNKENSYKFSNIIKNNSSKIKQVKGLNINKNVVLAKNCLIKGFYIIAYQALRSLVKQIQAI